MKQTLTLLTAILLASLVPLHSAETKPLKPNIIYILVDDAGYGDFGCYGQKTLISPNVDRLAAEGMKFTRHYAGCTVCAPSRCVLMTGLRNLLGGDGVMIERDVCEAARRSEFPDLRDALYFHYRVSDGFHVCVSFHPLDEKGACLR